MTTRRKPPPRLPPYLSQFRYAHGDIDLDVPHADPERKLKDQKGVVIGYHEVNTPRTRSGPDYLLAMGTIGQHHCDTAHRYMAVVAAMGGHRDGEWGTGVRIPPHQQGHPTEAMVNANTAMRLAIDMVGKAAMGIIGAVCLDGATMAGLEILRGEPEGVMKGRLRAALERLAEVWGMDGRNQAGQADGEALGSQAVGAEVVPPRRLRLT